MENLEKIKHLIEKLIANQEQDNKKEITDKKLTIMHIKNTNYTNNNKLKIKALLGIDKKTNNKIPNSIMNFLLFKIFNITSSPDYKISNSNELIDRDGNIINSQNIDKIKYTYLKKIISESYNKNNGNIDNDYKKNKITSLLLKSRIVKSFRISKFNKDVPKENYSSNKNNDLIYKGMGKC